MRKLTAGLFISLDGVIERPDQWHFPYFNDEMGAAVDAQMKAADAMLLGRVTYDGFAAYWPDSTDDPDLADYMNNTQKYVVSTTLSEPLAWQNSTLISGDVVEEIRKLKEQPGENIGMSGSAVLVRSLLQAGLIDELHLLVHPIVVGTGQRLFEDDSDQVPLKLLDSKTFSTGVLWLTYGPAGE